MSLSAHPGYRAVLPQVRISMQLTAYNLQDYLQNWFVLNISSGYAIFQTVSVWSHVGIYMFESYDTVVSSSQTCHLAKKMQVSNFKWKASYSEMRRESHAFLCALFKGSDVTCLNLTVRWCPLEKSNLMLYLCAEVSVALIQSCIYCLRHTEVFSFHLTYIFGNLL